MAFLVAFVMAISVCVLSPIGKMTTVHAEEEEDEEETYTSSSILWRVIKVEGKYGYLLADRVLDCKRFNKAGEEYKWDNSYLKTWLNGEFYNSAFSAEEKSVIVKARPGIGSTEYSNVFIPSVSDMLTEEYGFSSNKNEKSESRVARPTSYAEHNGTYVENFGCAYWVLEDDGSAATIRYDGLGYNYGYSLDDIGVRPLIVVDLTSPLVKLDHEVSAGGSSFSGNGGICNPRIENGETIWSCVTFGSYFQNSSDESLIVVIIPDDVFLGYKIAFIYSSLTSDTISITAYENGDKKTGTVVVPEIIDNKRVVKLESDSIKASGANSIILPDNLQVMAPNCVEIRYMTEVTIPKNVEEISNSFAFCPSLENIYVSPDSEYLKSIDGVLYNKSGTVLCDVPANKSSVVIPSTVTKIGTEAFLNCKYIKSVEIPSSVKVINDYAFLNTGLKSVTIPKSVTNIGKNAFGFNWNRDVNSFSADYDFTINCYKGTAGEAYAKANGLKYVVLDAEPEVYAMSDCTINLGGTSYVYDGSYKRPAVTVKYGSTALFENTDYTLTYSDNLNSGTGYVTITGKGQYTGSVKKSFTISKASLASAELVINPSSYTYDGNAKQPGVSVKINGKTLVKDTDYTISYSNNVNAGTNAGVTVTGKGNYTSSVSGSFVINAQSISAAEVKLSSNEYTYDGTAKQPAVTVTLSGKTLVKDSDYTVSYSNNINAGTASVKITGKANYTGEKTVSFSIKEQETPPKEYKQIKDAKVTLSQTVYAYDGNAKKPTVTVTYNGKKLVKGTDYKMAFSNNTYIGTAKVKITGIGDYTGSITKGFKIKRANLTYRAYLQKKGWLPWATAADTISKNPGTAGGKNDLRMETIQMQLSGIGGYVSYRAYVQKEGWTAWARTDNKTTYAGTKGKSLRVESIQIKPTGEIATAYDLYYRSYSDSFGWLGWAKNGETSGTAGYSYKLRGFQVMLYPKGHTAPAVGKNKPYIKKGGSSTSSGRKTINASSVPDYSKAQYMISHFQSFIDEERTYDYKKVLSNENILNDVLEMPSFLGIDSNNIFSFAVSVKKDYDMVDPLGRFPEVGVWQISESNLNWLCKNVLNISDSDLSSLKSSFSSQKAYLYGSDYYVLMPATGATNFATVINKIETDGTYYYFDYELKEPETGIRTGKCFEAVMKRKTSNGNSYWSVYSVTKK